MQFENTLSGTKSESQERVLVRTIQMKMSLICMKINLRVKLIFISKGFEPGLVLKQRSKELGNGFFLFRVYYWEDFKWFTKIITISTVFRTFSMEITLSCPTPRLAYRECTGHWLKMDSAATKADPPQLDTPAVIKWSVVIVLAIARPFWMQSMTRFWTFPMPISFPPSPIPMVEIFPDSWAENINHINRDHQITLGYGGCGNATSKKFSGKLATKWFF